MAEITSLKLDVVVSTNGFKEIEVASKKTSKAINKDFDKLSSTFELLNKQSLVFGPRFQSIADALSILSNDFSTFGKESQQALISIEKSTDKMVRKLETAKPIIEQTKNSLEFNKADLGVFDIFLESVRSGLSTFRTLLPLIPIIKTFFPIFRVFAEVKIEEVGNRLKNLLRNVSETARTNFQAMNEFLRSLKESGSIKIDQLTEFLNRVRDFGKLKLDNFSEFVNQLKEAGKLRFDQISNFLKSISEDAIRAASENFTRLFDFIKTNGLKAFEFLTSIPGKVVRGLFTSLTRAITGFGRLLGVEIPASISEIIIGILAIIPVLVLVIRHWDDLDKIIKRIPEAISKINEEIDNLIRTSIAFMSGVITKLTDTVSHVWDAAKEKASEAWEEIKGVVSGAVETIKGYFGGIGESLSNVWKSAKETTSNAWKSIEQRVSNGVRAIKETLGGIKESATKAFEDVFGGSEAPPAQFKPLPPVQQRLILDPDLEEQLNKQREEIERTNKAIDDQTKLFPPLNNALAMAGGEVSAFTLGQGDMSDAVNGVMTSVVSLREKGIDPLAGQTDELAGRIDIAKGQAEQAAGTFNTFGISLGNLNDLNKAFGGTQDQVNQSLETGSVAFDNAGASAQEFGDTIEQVQNTGGFFEGIKQGFKDFVENVQSNSELMANFFADTLSQMSQNFSDLFFNVLTGKFDDLKDLAKQAFEAILRSFLDLVSAIATRQIVISIAGVLGFDTKGASAGDVLGLGKQVAGIGGDLAGIFGGGGGAAAGGAAIAGGATSIGTGTVAIGSGLGGISSVGTGAAAVGATSVLDVGAAGGALGGISTVVPETGGFLAGIGGVAGAITIVGAVLAAAALAFTFLAPLFKKTPRLDIDFDSVKTEVGRRAAQVAEFLDADFFKDSIAQISVKRSAGLGAGGDDAIKDIIQKKIKETIEAVQEIIFKLPSELAAKLNEALLNTTVDIDTVVKGERLLEFDAKGKEIKAKFEAFVNGELQAKFLFAIRDFFQGAFESLGVLPGKAGEFLDAEFEKFKKAGSREERGKIGQELLASFNAFVDAFNIVSGNMSDAIGQTIQNINSLAQELNFEAVPSIGELKDSLAELIKNAELDPETVQKYADLRNAIVQGISDIINSISGLIGKISQLNETIVGFGGQGIDIGPFLDQAATEITSFLQANMQNLSLSEQEGFLDQLAGVANAQLAQEQAVFQAQQQAAQAVAEAQKDAIQKRIDGLNKEKDKINEAFQKRIDALNEELKIAQDFAALTDSIRQTLDSILFSPESVLTGVEQVNAIQSNIANLQQQLSQTIDPEKQLDLAGQLEDAFKTLFDTAGDAFGVNSPEFVAIFDQVTGGLSSLADLTETRGRTVEEINAEIERLTAENQATLASIDAKIDAAQERLASIGEATANNTFHASQQLQETFEFLRNEYLRILQERFDQLGEVTDTGFTSEVEGLGAIADLSEQSLTALKDVSGEAFKHTGLLQEIADKIRGVAGFQHGSDGLRNFGRGTFAVLHGLEAVITAQDLQNIQQGLISQFAAGLNIGSSLSQFATSMGEMNSPLPGAALSFRKPQLGRGFVPEIPAPVTGPSTGEPMNQVTSMNVDINVNVNGGSQGAVTTLAHEIENMMVRSIRQGRVRKELQEAAVRRVG